jgi:ribosome maturation factor RimP
MKKNISPALLEVIEKTVLSCGVELYDVESRGNILQVLITKPLDTTRTQEGVSVDTCAMVSETLSREFDMKNLIPTRYFLEISSPGIERKLRNQKDYAESLGYTISVHTKAGNFIGKLLDVSETGITIKNLAGSSAKADTEQFISYNDINSGRILISDDELFNKAKSLKAKGQKNRSQSGHDSLEEE